MWVGMGRAIADRQPPTCEAPGGHLPGLTEAPAGMDCPGSLGLESTAPAWEPPAQRARHMNLAKGVLWPGIPSHGSLSEHVREPKDESSACWPVEKG